VRSILPIFLKLTQMTLAGATSVELPPLRTVPIEVPYWSDGTLAFH
jgi:hypothetical protein